MFLRKMRRFSHSLAFRLSLLFSGILTFFSIACVIIFYMVVISITYKNADLYLLGEARESENLLATKGIETVVKGLSTEIMLEGHNDLFFRIIDSNGRQLYASNLSAWQDVQMDNHYVLTKTAPFFETLSSHGRHSVVRVINYAISPSLTLQFGENIHDRISDINESLKIMSLIMTLMIVAAMLTGWFMARQSLAGIHRLNYIAGNISQNDLKSRVPIRQSGDELDQLSVTFNNMLDRIENIVRTTKETNDNIAHELRSPITRIRSFAETASMSKQHLQDNLSLFASSIIEECDRLSGIFNIMLKIAEAETHVVNWPMLNFDFKALIYEACELYEEVAAAKGVILSVSIPANISFNVCGDIRQIQLAVANILDNAVKYSADGTNIKIEVKRLNADVVASFSNNGPGIAPDDLPNIFNRFYRGNNSSAVIGNGLGLSLSLAIIRAHGGSITVASQPDRLTTFTVQLPACSDVVADTVSGAVGNDLY